MKSDNAKSSAIIKDIDHSIQRIALMSGKTPEEVSKMLNLPLEEIKKVQEQQMTVNK